MNADEKPPLTVSVTEAGKMLGLSRNTAYELAAQGRLPTLRMGRKLLVPRAALDAMLNTAIESWRERQQQKA